jgi:EF hand domain-containing protein
MKATPGLSALALLGGMGLALTALPAGAQQMTCDTNSDGMVHATEATTCAAQRFDQAAGGQQEMTQEQFGAAHPDAESGVSDLFGQVDADASGAISREEWMTWREQRFGEATQDTDGRMPSADYETFDRRGAFPTVQ